MNQIQINLISENYKIVSQNTQNTDNNRIDINAINVKLQPMRHLVRKQMNFGVNNCV